MRLARENPRWGYLRIVAKLRKLGVTVSKASVATVLGRHGLPPVPRREGPTWSPFLSAQDTGISATDFFGVDSGTPAGAPTPASSSRWTAASCTCSE